MAAIGKQAAEKSEESTDFEPLPCHKRRRLRQDNTSEVQDEATSKVSSPSCPFPPGSSTHNIEDHAAKSKRGPTLTHTKTWTCDYDSCGSIFDRRSKLVNHQRMHTNERPFACGDCGKTFTRIDHMNRHVKDAHVNPEVRKHFCTYALESKDGEEVQCGKSFPTASKLRRHAAAHEGPKTCREPGCGKIFRKLETLERHVKQDHLGEDAFCCTHRTINDHGEEVPCAETFPTIGHLKGHERRAHNRTLYSCELCDNVPEGNWTGRPVFATYMDLQAHNRTAHPPTCSECGKKCPTSRSLRAHMEIEHSTSSAEPRKFPCTWPDCHSSFTRSGNLKVHERTVHLNVRPYVCGEYDLHDDSQILGWNHQGCGFGFKTKANLVDHIRTRHLNLPGKLRPSKLARLRLSNSTPSTLTDVDGPETPAEDDLRGLSELTGYRYEHFKKIACLVEGCQMRFSREHDLVPHVELTHGWHIDDVNDVLAEREALHGEQFWIGGDDGIDEEVMNDITLRQENQIALATGVGVLKAHHDLAAERNTTDARRGAKAMSKHSIMLDPALVCNEDE